MAVKNMSQIFGLAKHHYADFVRVFQKYPQIEKVLIFGSRAKQTAKPYSDFDLAVIAPEMSDEDFAELWTELSDLPIVFKLDVLHWDRLGNAELKKKIMKEGVNFYPLKSS